MTRKTLYFHLLAWLALAQGHAELYYYLLPKKSKRPWSWRSNRVSVWMRLAVERIVGQIDRDYASGILGKGFYDWYDTGPRKIGDTIQ